MNITESTEIVLRNAEFQTWHWQEGDVAALCFEGRSVFGFAHIFDSATALLNDWSSRQRLLLQSYAPRLRTAGAKAWNVYSIFLTSDGDATQSRRIQAIEEDFSQTRKLARAAIRTAEDLDYALLPLTQLRSQSSLARIDYDLRLRTALTDLPSNAVSAFFAEADADDIAMMLGERL